MSQLINCMIIGAPKAGTTSLHRYLSYHPLVCTHNQLEITYFVNDATFEQGYQSTFKRYFASCQTEQKVFLGKSVGIMYLPLALERLYDHNSAIKLVLVLRNPIRRAYSAYWYARRMGWENIKRFEDAIFSNPDRFNGDWIKEKSCAYLERSRYIEPVRMIFQKFPSEQVMILLTDDMRDDPLGVCNQIYKSIDLPLLSSIDTAHQHNTAALARSEFFAQILSERNLAKKMIRKFLPARWVDQSKSVMRKLNEMEFTPPPISRATYEHLLVYFNPFNDELADFIGRDLSHWNN